MARSNLVFVCAACRGETPKWQGQCPQCGEWNTLEQRAVTPGREARTAVSTSNAQPRRLETAVAGISKRLATGHDELDRVMGGGIVPGSVTLLGGDPGIGKSTLLLQVAAHVAATNGVLYASGEESVAQIGSRAQRLSLESPLEVVAPAGSLFHAARRPTTLMRINFATSQDARFWSALRLARAHL